MIVNLQATYPTPSIGVAANSATIDFSGGAAQVAALSAASAAASAAALQPAVFVETLIASSQFAALVLALFQALPRQTEAGVAPVASGEPYINLSGFPVFAQ